MDIERLLKFQIWKPIKNKWIIIDRIAAKDSAWHHADQTQSQWRQKQIIWVSNNPIKLKSKSTCGREYGSKKFYKHLYQKTMILSSF